MRGVTLISLPTHLVHSAVFGPYSTNEMLYAKQLVAGILDESLTVFDREFLSAEILCSLTGSGVERHFLIPAKSNGLTEVPYRCPPDRRVAHSLLQLAPT